ncbi:MAG: AAA family ATPase [Thermoleophilia bacterium]
MSHAEARVYASPVRVLGALSCGRRAAYSWPLAPDAHDTLPLVALVEALSRPEAYPFPVERVDVLHTHVSVLFFAGPRVYKVKKPVDLGFLDFREPAARRRACAEEVRLNEALAPGVYLGVAPIGRDERGELRIGGPGEPVEVAVEMVRLPVDRMLDRLLADDDVGDEAIDELARLLAGFHAAAGTGPGVDEHGSPEAVAANVRENFAQTRGHVAAPGEAAPGGARTVSPALHAYLEAEAERLLAEDDALLRRRVAEGRVRDGHGDLHAGNVCLAPRGTLVYDRIEFAARFRCGDVACDLAFLTMDLDERGHHELSARLVRRYVEASGDAELVGLLPFYEQYRAIVRAKVLGLAASDLAVPGEARERSRLDAVGYWLLAAGYALPPALVLTCGLPASGKSTVARELARALRAPLLASDARRKQLAGLTPTARTGDAWEEGIYSVDASDRVYTSLLGDAGRSLDAGRSVVVDATFAAEARRAPFLELADERGVPLLLVEAVVPVDEAHRRLAARRLDRSAVSDADVVVYERLRDAYEPPGEVPAEERVALESVGPPVELAARAIDVLVGRARASG